MEIWQRCYVIGEGSPSQPAIPSLANPTILRGREWIYKSGLSHCVELEVTWENVHASTPGPPNQCIYGGAGKKLSDQLLYIPM